MATAQVLSPNEDHEEVVPLSHTITAIEEADRSHQIATARRSRPPQAVGVVLTGSAPARVFWEGQKYIVREIGGPWRVSGQWWSEANWCREEWDVRLGTETSERVCRIAFDPRSRCWYVQGTYD